MKEISKCGAQGDCIFRRVDMVPSGFAPQLRKGPIICAHSETGHHHAIDATGIVQYVSPDPLKCYLVFETAESADVVHHRSYDTHETVRLLGGIGSVWEVRRQREWAPEGWRRVED